MIGKNTRIATTIHLRERVRIPNQLFMIGAKAMIGTEFAAIANGSSARLAWPTARSRRDDERGHTADDESADRLDEGVASDRLELVEMLANAAAIELGGGRRNCWMESARTASSPQREYAENTATAGT